MAFHAYSAPADFVFCYPTARSFIYGDADLVSSNVVIAAGFQGLAREKGSNRSDGPTVYGQSGVAGPIPDVGPGGILTDGASGAHHFSTAYPWGVTGGLMYLSTNSGAGLSHTLNLDNGYLHNDIAVDVSTTTGYAGIILHASTQSNPLMVYLDIAAGRVKAAQVASRSINLALFTGTTTVSAGTTYRLRASENSSNVVSVYLDGNLEGTFDLSGVLIGDSGTVLATTVGNPGLVTDNIGARYANFYIAPQAPMAATNYNIRNYDGDIVYSATVAALADPTLITIPDSSLTQRLNRGPYGWYRGYLTGPDHGDGQWGTAYGDFAFCRIPTRSGFPANGLVSEPGVGARVDEIARGVMALGPNRCTVSSATTGTVAANNAQNILSAPLLKTYWVDYATSLRPRKTIGTFDQGTAGIEASVVTPTVAALSTWVKAWEPRNEPEGTAAATFVSNEQAPFYTAVKNGDASATVLGPSPVSFNDGTIQWIRDFFTAGGGNYCDGLSVHAYNCFNGDIATARYTLTNLKAAMATAGFTKPLYQTEQGHGWEYAGVVEPRYAARFTALLFFMCELYGLPVENNHYWYDTQIGFDAFPMWWTNLTGIGPQPVPIRNMVAEIGNRTLTAQFDFGTHGNTLYAGGTWTAADGSKTVGLMATSYGQRDLVLDVSGASSLTCVDTWGNTFTLTVTNSQVTFPIAEMPQWVRCPVGVTVTPASLALTTNLALTATVTSDGVSGAGGPPYSAHNQTAVARINDGIQQNQYRANSSGWAGDANAPYHIVNSTLPLTITLTWASPQTINRVIVHSFPPLQDGGAPLAFTIDTWDGASWTTRYTKTAPTSKSFAFTSGSARCVYETYFDEQWVFDAAFTAVSASKVRMVITATSRASSENGLAYDNLWGGWDAYGGAPPIVTIREIQAFNATSTPDAPPRLRNPAMGGVTS